MTPHAQVKELVRSISQEFTLQPIIWPRSDRIGGWTLWRGREIVANLWLAKDACRQRRRMVALAVLDTLEVFTKHPTLDRKRDAFVDGVDAASDETVEMYLRDLIIAQWEHEIFTAMERTRQ